MATQVQRRRGTAAEHTTFTGAAGEITVDSTDNRLVLHDGVTAGGHPVAKESEIPVVANFVAVDGSSVMTGSLKFEGTTADAFETALHVVDPTADRAINLPDADGTLPLLEVDQNWTGSQRSAPTTDNDLSFDLAAATNFTCTPTALGTLTFTNIASQAGQTGIIKLVNGSAYAISAHANTKKNSTFLATVSATGTYIISYYCDGTDVYVSTDGATS